jgi:hypothetical protein
MKKLTKTSEKQVVIFSGKAGGFMAEFAKLIKEVRQSEYAPINFEVPPRVNECRLLMHQEVKQVLARLRHGKELLRMKLMHWVLNGNGTADRANTFLLIGMGHDI